MLFFKKNDFCLFSFYAHLCGWMLNNRICICVYTVCKYWHRHLQVVLDEEDHPMTSHIYETFDMKDLFNSL